MKKAISLLSLIVTFLMVLSQELELTNLNVPGNSVAFKHLVHASIYMEINGKTIYVDPWGDQLLYKGLKKADAIVITDIHPDHYSVENIKGVLQENTFFIVPIAVYDLMPEEWQSKCSVLNNEESIKFNEINLKITTVAMYNIPEKKTQPHRKGRGNGYIFDINGFRIYVSGDTGDTEEIRSLKDIEIAFVCMNIPFTMSVDQAASAVKEFKPKTVYPYHYRNADKSLADVEWFCKLVQSDDIKCVLLDWY